MQENLRSAPSDCSLKPAGECQHGNSTPPTRATFKQQPSPPHRRTFLTHTHTPLMSLGPLMVLIRTRLDLTKWEKTSHQGWESNLSIFPFIRTLIISPFIINHYLSILLSIIPLSISPFIRILSIPLLMSLFPFKINFYLSLYHYSLHHSLYHPSLNHSLFVSLSPSPYPHSLHLSLNLSLYPPSLPEFSAFPS